MGPKERAVYLRRPLPKGRHAAEQSGEEEAGTVAGTNAAALRAWLRQVCQRQTLHPVPCIECCSGQLHNRLVSDSVPGCPELIYVKTAAISLDALSH